MEFKGRYVIAAAPNTVWAALNDPAVLAKCIPGCERVEKISPTEFTAAAQVKIGPVKARFEGKVGLTAHTPEPGFAYAAILSGEGRGGAAGFAKGSSEVRLQPGETGTILTYTATANVGGRLAQIGQRLIDGVAKAIADEFFAKFADAVATSVPEVEPEQPAPELEPPKGLPTLVWVSGLILAIVALVAAFSYLL